MMRKHNVGLTAGESEPLVRLGSKARIIDFSAAWSIAKNSLRISVRYPANFLVWAILPLLWLLPFIFTGIAFSGGITNPLFGSQSGHSAFIPYLVLGWVVYSYVDSSIWGVGNTLRWYQFAGVLEPMFLIPVPRLSILFGAAIAEIITTTLSTSILFTLCVFLFGLTFSFNSVFPILLLLFLMIIAFTGFAFAFSGIILVFKDPSVLTEFVDTLIFTITPVNFPVSTLPFWAQPLSLLLPSTFAIMGIRAAALTAAGLSQLWIEIIILLILAISFWILGIIVFRFAERYTRKKGKMGTF